jgi:hypothetical protein
MERSVSPKISPPGVPIHRGRFLQPSRTPGHRRTCVRRPEGVMTQRLQATPRNDTSCDRESACYAARDRGFTSGAAAW